MRLIDSEELKHRVNNSKYYGTERQRDFCDMITESETIDAVEVVRCRDCKHSHTVDFTNTPANVIKRFCEKRRDAQTGSYTVQDNDYCSYGERREDGEA